MKTKKISKLNDDNTFITEEDYPPPVNLFEQAYDDQGGSLGIYLGTKKVHVHHSGEGTNFNLDDQDILEKIIEGSWFSEEDICLKLVKIYDECTTFCMDKHHTYQIYGVNKK